MTFILTTHHMELYNIEVDPVITDDLSALQRAGISAASTLVNAAIRIGRFVKFERNFCLRSQVYRVDGLDFRFQYEARISDMRIGEHGDLVFDILFRRHGEESSLNQTILSPEAGAIPLFL